MRRHVLVLQPPLTRALTGVNEMLRAPVVWMIASYDVSVPMMPENSIRGFGVSVEVRKGLVLCQHRCEMV